MAFINLMSVPNDVPPPGICFGASETGCRDANEWRCCSRCHNTVLRSSSSPQALLPAAILTNHRVGLSGTSTAYELGSRRSWLGKGESHRHGNQCYVDRNRPANRGAPGRGSLLRNPGSDGRLWLVDRQLG